MPPPVTSLAWTRLMWVHLSRCLLFLSCGEGGSSLKIKVSSVFDQASDREVERVSPEMLKKLRARFRAVEGEDPMRTPLAGPTGTFPLPTAIKLFGFGLRDQRRACQRTLADSGCRLIVLNLRAPCSSPHERSSVFSVLPNQTSSSQFISNLPAVLFQGPEPRRLRQSK